MVSLAGGADSGEGGFSSVAGECLSVAADSLRVCPPTLPPLVACALLRP